jgi:hypothetical protein
MDVDAPSFAARISGAVLRNWIIGLSPRREQRELDEDSLPSGGPEFESIP